MHARALTQPRLLLVEPDAELREILSDLLSEEGYELQSATTLQEALALLDRQPFVLVLADLFAGVSKHAFTQAQILRRRANPTPVGLLMTNPPRDPEAAQQSGFACVISMPFELDDFLMTIATCVNQPLTLDQQRQVETVRRYFDALTAGDWDAVLDLCSEEVAYYPPVTSRVTTTRKLSGKAAYHAYLVAATPRYPGYVCQEVMTFARPKGLAVHYRYAWLPRDATPQHGTGSVLFHFQGDLISQIGVHLPPASPAEASSTGQAGSSNMAR